MKFIFKITVFVFAISLQVSGQREAANWYFGDQAGLDFNSGTPVPLFNGQISTIEGCESFSDPEGNLLFYTDGRTVWNRIHEIMPNGDGLLGSFSSSQSALIIPKIDDDDIYFVFTPDVVQSYTDGGNGNGLNYSIVNMSLNGGLGDVTTKNQNLLSQGSEKISAVSAFDGSGFWVVTHHVNKFYSYKVGASGVNSTPVISTIGPSISGFNNIRGGIKFSPNGDKIVIAHCIFDPLFDGSVLLYDFNTTTGLISNEKLVAQGRLFYSVEFSSNSSKLYASGKVIDIEVNETSEIEIYQYDLLSTNISNSEFLISSYPNLLLGDLAGTLQIAIDRKIYHSIPNRKLSVIRTPNLHGLDSDFRQFHVDLGGNQTNFGLPPYIQSFFESIVSIENFCAGSATEFNIESDEVIESIDWNFGDPISGVNNISNLLNPTHIFTSAGVYTVTIDVNFLNRPSKTYIEFVEISERPDALDEVTLVQCEDSLIDDGISIFNLNEALSLFNLGNIDLTANYFLSVEDAQNNKNALPEIGYQNVYNHQIIYARVFENSECYRITKVELEVKPISNLGMYGTIDICSDLLSLATSIEIDQVIAGLMIDFPDTDISVYQNEENPLLERDKLEGEIFIGFNEPLELFFRVEINNSCDVIGKIGLNALPTPEVENQVFAYCNGAENVLDAGEEFLEYLWSTGETTQTITIDSPGIYKVEVFNGICANSFQINVFDSTPIGIKDVILDDFKANNTLKIVANTNDGYLEYSIDGIHYTLSNTFTNLAPGLLSVFLRKDNCSIAEETIIVGGYPAFFTPNGDGYHDTWQISNPRLFQEATIEIYDRYGKLLKTMNSLSTGWDGTFNGELLRVSDYWFLLKLGNREVTGHFTLKL